MIFLGFFVVLMSVNFIFSNPLPFDYNAPYDIYVKMALKKSSKGYFFNKANKWPNGIVPYVIDPGFSSENRSVILSGIKLIEDSTRLNGTDFVKFVERTTQSNYIYIFNGNGCWSYVGMQNDLQPLSLNSQGCIYSGTVAHELIHALGFLHEQSRPDRDQYVRINWENIIKGVQSNFEIIEGGNTFGLKYDYDSIMHYEATAFSIDNESPTIEPLQDGIELKEKYKQNFLSETDIQEIRISYESTNDNNVPISSAKTIYSNTNTICLVLIISKFVYIK